MYQIFADSVLIYDSTLEDYKIGKGQITLEVSKSGSFVFSVYPDHFYYDRFVKMRTVITVYKSGCIVFRGRILNDVTDYWNNKTITCEGELGFLNDSIIRPFTFEGTPAALFRQFIETHNAQVDEFKQFRVGTVDIADANDYIARDNTAYETTQSNLASRLTDSGLGGYIYITHGDDGTDPIPTLHYVKDFSKVATQSIEFGVNLKDYTKTINAEDIATAIIPFGAQYDDGDANTENPRLTIESVNNGVDYVYDAEAVALRGWIFKVVTWDDVTVAANLKARAESWLATGVNQTTTIDLTAIDLHLLDRSIESFRVCEYVRVRSTPHGFDEVMLCSKQTMDLLKPESDTVTLGYTYSSFTERSSKLAFSVSQMSVKQNLVSGEMSALTQHVNSFKLEVENSETSSCIKLMAGETEINSADIKLTGFVTFEGLSGGTTTIDGACIKTGTINADRINLTGQISFSDFDAATQNTINSAGGISAAEATTLITSTLVSSPTIKGGQFYDLANYGRLSLAVSSEYGNAPWLKFEDVTNNVRLFEIVPLTRDSSWVGLRLGGYTALSYRDGVVYPSTNWDFSGVNVNAKFA